MRRTDRKKWLLTLWEYHNGGLRENEINQVDTRLAADPKARTDSQHVLGIINELRQEGRWETHPEFPAQMVDRILQREKGGGAWRWAVVAAVAILLLLYLLFGRGDSAAQGVTGAFAQFRNAFLALFEKPSDFAPAPRFDTSELQLGPGKNVDLDFGEEWIPSASLDLDRRIRPRPTMHLEDPVSGVEDGLDALFDGGFAPAP